MIGASSRVTLWQLEFNGGQLLEGIGEAALQSKAAGNLSLQLRQAVDTGCLIGLQQLPKSLLGGCGI